jgi:hypothetical protein
MLLVSLVGIAVLFRRAASRTFGPVIPANHGDGVSR